MNMNNRGIVYLIQPAELIGTNRFKIGISKKNNLDRCINGYIKGTRYLSIVECINPLVIKKILKNKLNNIKNCKLIASDEYFEWNEIDILKLFNSTVIDYIYINECNNGNNI